MQSAELFLFPIDRRASLIRNTARALCELHGEPANAFWRQTARDLYRELLAIGNDDASARAEISRFSDSVQCEMRGMTPPARSSITA